MPPYPSTTPTTLLFLTIFILAFFPGLFISILKLPLVFLVPSAHHSSKNNHKPNPSLPACPQHCTPSSLPTRSTMWVQKTITLPSSARGSYLITSHVESALGAELRHVKVGLVNLFMQHTSSALSLNENWDEDVRADMSDALDRIVPEAGATKGGDKEVRYRHAAEGSDDMPVG